MSRSDPDQRASAIVVEGLPQLRLGEDAPAYANPRTLPDQLGDLEICEPEVDGLAARDEAVLTACQGND
jgi:hypothetical protein